MELPRQGVTIFLPPHPLPLPQRSSMNSDTNGPDGERGILWIEDYFMRFKHKVAFLVTTINPF